MSFQLSEWSASRLADVDAALDAWVGRDAPAGLGEAMRYAGAHWHFFETFVTAETHWLAPDNFQEDPAPLVAMRTSAPTIVPFETVDDGDLYASGVRYLVWTDGGPDWMSSRPEVWAARTVLACMTWSKEPARICLYELPDEPD